VHDFRKIATRFKREESLNEDALEGYINIQILHEIIHHISAPLTKEKIILAMENIKDFNFKGILLNFDPVNRELSKSVWIDHGQDRWTQFFGC